MLKDKNLYYVGGFVRDEILGIESKDIDFCYEGDAIEFVQSSGFNILKINEKFHTVRILIGNSEIDIASTRQESYPKKGHLPEICKIGVPIEEDLKRRDFSVNAIAKRTTDNEIIDIFNGKEDIKNKKLRILHSESFIDDPTRIIRGLKFSVRFGFKLEEGTKLLQDEYLENVNYDMSYHRLKNELKDAFKLNRHEIFDKFIEQKMYKLLSENQDIPKINSMELEKLINKYPSENSWLIYLSFFDISKLNLTKAEKRIFEWYKKLDNEDSEKNTPFESIIMHGLRNK